MHELAITQSIIDLAIETAKRENARTINGIDLVIGDLSSIVDDSVQFYFDILSKETLAAGAQLHFRREPAISLCQACGAQTPVKPPVPPFCPECGRDQITIRGGRDFRMESIDIET